MRALESRLRLFLALCAIWLIQPGALAHDLAVKKINNWDVAVLDKILAGVRPGQKMVAVGDMGFKVTVLKAWRDHLASTSQRSTSVAGEEPASAFAGGVVPWTNGIIPYTFDAGVTAAHQQAFLDAAGEWATFVNIQFVARTNEANYLLVKNAPDDSGEGGFSSGVGMIGGEQYIQIGANSWNRDTLCHEIGHVLGLVHEHQRSDRDSFVTILTQNIEAGSEGNFVKLPDSDNKGAYDFLSIMHYSKNADSTDRATLNTIEPLAPYSQYLDLMGTQYDRVLSADDRSGMAQVYGANPTPNSSVVTNTKDSGLGSLRAAIYYGIDHPGTTITFDIPTSDPGFSGGVFTIQPSDYMTRPTGGTIIDGSTQTGGMGNPVVVLDGTVGQAVGTYEQGIRINEAGCVIKGLQISNFSGSGIVLFGGATNNVIGGTTTSARNVISGNLQDGVLISDGGTTGNLVEGNYIGVARDGTTASPNAYSGVEIAGGAQGNVVGGSSANAANVVSGNTIDGVRLDGTNTDSNTVAGNLIGVQANGTAVLANGGAGVDVFGSAQTSTIGPGNVISGNVASGIIINACNGTTVQGNYIGLGTDGATVISNSQAGVYISNGSQNTTVGGTSAAARNVISGNTNDGVDLNGVTNTLVEGNYVGVDYTGSFAKPNGAGIALFSNAGSNTIGGTLPGARNIISGNTHDGVSINGGSGNVLEGNYIGLDATGENQITNGGAGVALFGAATNDTIGGTLPGVRNIISGNTGDGVNINGGSGNVLEGNYIGLDAAGENNIGNGGSGVDIFGVATNDTIGGTAAGTRNFICASTHSGIVISGSGTNSNLVQGNTIGLNILGAAVGNGEQGIALFGGAQSNTIGGSAIGASNLIAGNTDEGVGLFDSTTIENTVSQNSIFSNHFAGIGVYTNSNNNQASPALSSAILSSATNPNGTDVSGTLSSTANTTFRIEIFASPSGGDEGEYFIGATNADTNGAGSAAFTISLVAAVPSGDAITATATDPNGNTSQFSFPLTVAATDSDGDGIPDNWTMEYFGHTTGQAGDKSLANDDADGDGMTNMQELLAGTDPTDPTSRFMISSINRNGGNPQINFQALAGKTYRLDYRDDLVLGTWSPLVDGIFSGTTTTLQITDPSAAGLTKRFYRLTLEP